MSKQDGRIKHDMDEAQFKKEFLGEILPKWPEDNPCPKCGSRVFVHHPSREVACSNKECRWQPPY